MPGPDDRSPSFLDYVGRAVDWLSPDLEGPEVRIPSPYKPGEYHIGAAPEKGWLDWVSDTLRPVRENPIVNVLSGRLPGHTEPDEPVSPWNYDPATNEYVRRGQVLTGTPDFNLAGAPPLAGVKKAADAAKTAKTAKAAADAAKAARAVKVGQGTTPAAAAAKAATGAKAAPVVSTAKALPPAAGASQTAADAAQARVQELFPKVDAYGKPASLVSAATIRKRAAAVTDLTPEAQAKIDELVEAVGNRRVQPEELHAIAAGAPYEPGRILRVPRTLKPGEKQIVGAPLGVANATDARKLREGYLQGMEEGVGGRDFYHDSGASILFHSNDNPERARRVAGAMAITSPTASVSTNTGFGIKANNQMAARMLQSEGLAAPPPGAVAVKAGRYPTAMGKNVETLYSGGQGATGLKRLPFSENLALGGRFHEPPPPSSTIGLPAGWAETEIAPGVFVQRPGTSLMSRKAQEAPPGKLTRAVHDIWDAEAHGYVNPDGTPMRTGFGPAQHRFMDTQQDKTIATANQRLLGGFKDWDELSSQAAAWTGQQVQAKRLPAGKHAKSYKDFIPEHYAQESRETIPGPSTHHMPELLRQPTSSRDAVRLQEERELLHRIRLGEVPVYDAEGRDQIAAAYGLMTGPGFEAPGFYKGTHVPGWQSPYATGSQAVKGGAPGARELDEGSKLLMDATGATYAIPFTQDAFAASRLLPAGSRVPRGTWDVQLPGGRITARQLDALHRYFGAGMNNWAPIPIPQGVRLGAGIDEDQVKAAMKLLGAKKRESGVDLFSGLASTYVTNEWDTLGGVGSKFLDPIRKLGAGGRRVFDSLAPGYAEGIRKADAMFRRETSGRVTFSRIVDETLAALAADGLAGLERLATKYGIPAALLTAGLGMLQEEGGQDSQGLALTSPEA